MSQHKSTQEEFKTIPELKNRFGNLAPKMPLSIEENCKTLTNRRIQELLHEKTSNMCIYAHYDLAEHSAGLLSSHYNGQKVEFSHFGNDANVIKSAIESNLFVIRLVATAIKTIHSDHWGRSSEYALCPIYDRHSSFVCGNVIFCNMQTGKFYAMRDWVCDTSNYSIDRASVWGLSQFMRGVAQNRDLRNIVLMDLSTAPNRRQR